MIRRSSRGLYRRLALALSLMLLASMLALPALANGGTPDNGIVSPEAGDVFAVGEQLNLEAFADGANSVQWAVRLVDPDPNSSGTVAGNVDGMSDGSVLADGHFTANVSTANWVPSTQYYFVFNPSPGGRYVVQFSLLDPAFEDFTSSEIDQCEGDDEECSIQAEGGTGQSFTASTDARGKDDGTAFLGLRIATGDDVAEEVRDACNLAAEGVNRAARLGPEVFQLVPVNFAEGSITVQSTIPRDVVFEQTARGAGIFQVCIAAEDEVYGGYGDPDSPLPKIGDTGLYGPVILANCDEDSTPEHACVLDKTKVDGDVVLTYQLPTVDPWGMS